MVGWVRQRPKVYYYKGEERRQIFLWDFIVGGKNIVLLETDLSRPTRY
jgi:hypothetical protein